MDFRGIIIGVGILIILLILAVRFRRVIILALIRMIYGKFSYEFFHNYKKYFVRSPYQYCFRDEFTTHLLFIVSKNEEMPSFKTKKEIYFENTPYFINYKDFLKKKGNPYCFNAFAFNQPDFVIKALGYQATIAGSKAILVFYFMNDSFFMGEYIFKNPKNDIKASLTAHFLEVKDLSGNNFYIENTKDQIIHYQNTGFTVDIKYLNKENKAIIENLKQYYIKVTGKKLVMEA
ncbi:MAG: hypothetical protein M0Q51_06320 [Bacteroidales bacterium]|nr:hypothetical protein [Bacteroidales bacterium]